MRSAWSYVGLIVLSLTAMRCERDLPFEVPSTESIDGYQIEGYVTDRLGIPVKGLRIGLWYDYERIDTAGQPSRYFFVDDTGKTVFLRAVDLHNNVIKVLYIGRAQFGELEYTWDKTDSTGISVRNGIYKIEFWIGSVLKDSHTVVVDRAVSAITDSLGHYEITNAYLPVGYRPVPRYSSDGQSFLGYYEITPYVLLEFYLDTRRVASVKLKTNEITRFDLRI